MNTRGEVSIQTKILFIDHNSGEILRQESNAAHYENFSFAVALALSDNILGTIQELHFGNGGALLNGDGTITYNPPNIIGQDAQLYNPTYYKIINDRNPLNTDPINNNIKVYHENGKLYSDIVINCLLDNNEPNGQNAFDNATDFEGDFVFSEIGLKTYSQNGNNRLITHAMFSPFEKSLNRAIEIQYSLRIIVKNVDLENDYTI